ncbi:hypothetical protein [Kineococcus radiotolerans]|uniref:RuvC-like resolvase n=1 Tax=Kineococcus radiotolerans (strain ATCC BAA-149 / DSM 14245 / SRS30216) TaxID=266940 RepID=A6W8U6_KINRD|nr:hypothetical protein [Kineococcus radiotolerans]ABS03235.1 hypothetical protein Krad_1749 [Kineococcus radiotolerans SRS30216 = ATCC BAA-149]
MSWFVVGIDPGGASTGIVVRHRNAYVAHAVIESDKAERITYPGLEQLPAPGYIVRITEALQDLTRGLDVRIYAIESVRAPSWHMGGAKSPMHPKDLIALGAIAGAVTGALVTTGADVMFVPPAGNGSRPLRSYPPELVGAREVKGGGILRHARSAWDVAGTAHLTTTRKES